MLQRVGDGKQIPLHKYEISCLANFIKDVRHQSHAFHDYCVRICLYACESEPTLHARFYVLRR
jgi:hypothetical protein